MLSFYTDGSCIDNKNGKGCGWAFALVQQGNLLTEQSGGCLTGSNNIGELLAATMALQYALDYCFPEYELPAEIEIVSDSEYVVKGLTTWIFKWKRNLWRSSSGEPVKNREYWEKLDELVEHLKLIGWKIKFRHVRGHTGDKFNEIVDKLAGVAARKYLDP